MDWANNTQKYKSFFKSLFNGVLFAFKYAFDLILNTELPIKLVKLVSYGQ